MRIQTTPKTTDSAILRDLATAVDAFESAWALGSDAELTEFLPSHNHPHFTQIAGELIRVDMEYRWLRGDPKPLEAYSASCRKVFEDSSVLEQVAFEEFRQRCQSGDDVSAEEYSRRYHIATEDWPAFHREDDTSRSDISRRGTESPHIVQDGSGSIDVSADGFPAVGSQILGFDLVGELGRGMFGRAYLARQESLANRFVVLKITTRPSLEPERLARLQHPHIVPVYSVHNVGELQAICMPFLGSKTLAELLHDWNRKQQGHPSDHGTESRPDEMEVSTLRGNHDSAQTNPLNEQPKKDSENLDQRKASIRLGIPVRSELPKFLEQTDAPLRIVAQIAGGLAHAHERGIVHRDLKPANVLITDDGRAMILDFNLADETSPVRKRAGLVGGTLPYMAPEQIDATRSGGPIGTRCDIYALGVILFEMLAGRRPFATPRGAFEQIAATMIKEREGDIPSVRRANPTVSRDVESIVNKCLDPVPEKRYQTAEDLLEDVQRHLDDLPLRNAPNRSLRERLKKWRRRHPSMASGTTVSIIAIVILSAVATLWTWRGQRIARLEAEAGLQSFQKDLSSVRVPLSTFGLDALSQAEAMDSARELLDRYQVDDSDDWRNEPAFRDLDPAGRDDLENHLGELLYLMATAKMRIADASGEPTIRNEKLGEALELNSWSRQVFGSVTPRAVLLQQAEIAKALKDPEQATHLRSVAQETTVRGPMDSYLIAIEYWRQRHFSKALAKLLQISHDSPSDFSVWYAMGHVRIGLRQFKEADECFSGCIALSGDSHLPYFYRGVCRIQEKRFDAARRDFNQVLLLRPNIPAALINRAIARQRLGDLAGAVDDLTRAIESGATETRVFFLRERVLKKQGEDELAEADRAEGLRRQPVDEESWVARGIAQLSDSPQKALADFREALRRYPRSRRALRNIAHVLAEHMKKTQEAITTLDELLKLDGDDPIALASRGVLHARLGHRQPATHDAEQALAVTRNANVLYQAACVFALTSPSNKGDADRSLALLKEAMAIQPLIVGQVLKDSDLKPLHKRREFRNMTMGAALLLNPGGHSN